MGAGTNDTVTKMRWDLVFPFSAPWKILYFWMTVNQESIFCPFARDEHNSEKVPYRPLLDQAAFCSRRKSPQSLSSFSSFPLVIPKARHMLSLSQL